MAANISVTTTTGTDYTIVSDSYVNKLQVDMEEVERLRERIDVMMDRIEVLIGEVRELKNKE